ncbi:uncharacterized protein LOC106654663 [Trichogramma pretiosum]|uniref:uncharacterized protein LOC106654663 n=1 Tax=Trichogramma pretiosum TaxID=7493 RepID=UPI0006C9CDC9|nr:uncharacterized protein LOC106654663 [Trichogramma pretiosum]XP_014230115.1 uncharacterized protein LOC106654663 [Trichogramma pretiosum]XP_014230116.1 uncharacterized protein LOC106654663 [Trichogramma pretiosum]
MTKDVALYVAPDGGWGWVVVIAYALNNIITIPIIQGFGMVYNDEFKRLNISATQSTVIININQAFGMILGMMNGPLIRIYGYRKISIIGSLFYATGIILTSFGTTFIHFVITYGMMASLGLAMTTAACSLAVNSFFKEKRGRAMGISMTITGLGPILMPQLVSVLLPIYDSGGTMLILGALSLHGLIGSSLLQPLKWHAKRIQVKENKEDDIKNEIEKCEEESESLMESKIGSMNDSNRGALSEKKKNQRISSSVVDLYDDNVSIYGFETPVSVRQNSILDLRAASVSSLSKICKAEGENSIDSRTSIYENERRNSLNENKIRPRLGSANTECLVLLKKPLNKSLIEEDEECENGNGYASNEIKNIQQQSPPSREASPKDEPKAQSYLKRILHRIVEFFDLDLLRDPIYVNIMLGMSIAIFAEFNFSVLTPFILSDMDLDTRQIATIMSVIACSDLVLRALAPYIGEWLHRSPRAMYLVSLFLLIFTRSCLLIVNDFGSIVIVAVGLGIAKGIRTVYMTLVIPSHVSLEKLTSASSIQSLVNGTLLIVFGPILGLIRDITGSYLSCVILINFVTAIAVVMWLSEFAIIRCKNQNKRRKRKLEPA